MTAPDYPDWSPGTVQSAVGQQLHQEDATPYPNYVFSLTDIAAWNTLVLQVNNGEHVSLNPISVQVTWSIQGDIVGYDYFTVGNGYTDVDGTIISTITMPNRGDEATFAILSAATAGLTRFTVNGSSRTIDRPECSCTIPGISGLPLSIDGTLVPAGGSLVRWYGPMSGPVNIAASGDTHLTVRAITYYLVNGVWQVGRISNPLALTSSGAAMTVDCPGRLCAVTVDNSDAVAHGVNLWVTEAS